MTTPKKDPQPKVQVFRSSRWSKDHARHPKTMRPQAATPRKTCGIHDICQTCRFINGDYQESLQTKYNEGLELLKEADLLAGTQLTRPQASPRPLEYRTHAKLAVRPYQKSANYQVTRQNRRFAIGLFQPQSHEIVDISHCPLHRHSINRLLRDLKAELESSPLTPYDEESGQGDLRYLAIRASHLTEELMLTFIVTNERPRLDLKGLAMRLRQKGHQLNSVYMNVNTENTNVIFGQQSKRLLGSDRLREQLCDLSFEIGPTSFFQVNPWQAATIYRRIEQIAGLESSQGVAWDLYCGIGQISMLLSQSGYRTLGIEENSQATRDAQRNAVRNELAQQTSFMAGRVEQVIDQIPAWAEYPKIIVVNPSRKGLAPGIRERLADRLRQNDELRLLYLSCEVTTLKRDLAELKNSGRHIRQLEAFDMFPFTDKMEWLAVIH